MRLMPTTGLRKRLCSTLIAGLVMGASSALAVEMPSGVRHGGGGDDVGLEFRRIGESVLDDIEKNHPSIRVLFENAPLREIVQEMKVGVIDAPLYVKLGTETQESVAVNDPDTKQILVNRPRWIAITDQRLKIGIVLHEVLSLARLEETGFYPISSRYIIRLGLTGRELAPSGTERTTYLSCVDFDNALFNVTASRDNRVQIEIRPLTENTLRILRSWLTEMGVQNASEAVAVSREFSNRSSLDRGVQTCTFSVSNRSLFSCYEDDFRGNMKRIPLEVHFQEGRTESFDVGNARFESTAISIQGQTVANRLRLNMSKRLELSINANSCRK